MASQLVLVLLPTFSQTIEQRICRGIASTLCTDDVQVLHVPLNYLPEQQSALEPYLWIHHQLVSLKPDLVFAYGGGLAYMTSGSIYQQVLDIYQGIPVVNMGNIVPGYPSVVVDNYSGMLALMTTILKRRTPEPIFYLGGPAVNEDSQLRLQALTDAAAQLGWPDDLITIRHGDFTASVAEQLFSQYLTEQELPARLIICGNDLTAKGVLDALTKFHYRCPEDFWVTGFDDFEYAASISPGLSTVHFPARDVGIEAAKIAQKLLVEKNAKVAQRTSVKAYPILRGTTADAHPGLAEYDKQLREQWALIHQRDANARKLTAIRSFQRRLPMSEILQNAKLQLADLDIHHLSVFTEQLTAKGKSQLNEIDLYGQQLEHRAQRCVLPAAFSLPAEDSYWLLCALEMEDQHFGYLVAQCAPVAAEFVEFLAPQITEQLNTEALEARNKSYREQNELNERMASLGSLVAGVAHEVNTPVGTGKLAASSLMNALDEVKQKLVDARLSKQDFETFLHDCDDYAELIFHSLDRAAKLISNFKMVSVDQSVESRRLIDLGEYIDSVLLSLRHRMVGTEVSLSTDLAAGIMVETYPGALAQVITNLFMNAMMHAFNQGTDAGEIAIRLSAHGGQFILEFADNGRGATKEVVKHIFDPFFTTARAAGGSGLGMHIVYNLVTQKLNWSVTVSSKPNKGMKITLQPADAVSP